MSPPDDLKRFTGRGISERIKGFEQLCKTKSGPSKNGESVKKNSIVQEHDRECVAKIVGADKEGSFKFTLRGRSSIESSEPTKPLQDTVSTSKGVTIGVEEPNPKDTQSKEAEESLADKLSQIDRKINPSKDPSNEDIQDLNHQNVSKQEFLPMQPKKGVLWKIRDVVQTFEKMRDVKLSKKAEREDVLVQNEDRRRISSTLEISDKDNPSLQGDIEAGSTDSESKHRTFNNSGGFEKCKERFGKEIPNVSTPEDTSRNADQNLLGRPKEERHKNDRAIECVVRTNNTSEFEESLGEDRFHKKLVDTSTTTDQKPCRNNVQGELKEERQQSRTRKGTKFKDAVRKFQTMSLSNCTPVIKEDRVEETSCESNCTPPIKEERLNDAGNKSFSGGKSKVCLPKVCKMGDDVETGEIGEETIVSSAVQNFETMPELNYRISVEKLRHEDTGHCPGSSLWKIRDKVANFEKLAKATGEENIPKSQNNKKSKNEDGKGIREAVQTCTEDPGIIKDSKDALNVSNEERIEIGTNEENVPHDSQGLSFKDEDAPVQNEESISKSLNVDAGTNEENRLKKSDSQGLLCEDEDTFDQSEKSAIKSFTGLTNAPGPIFRKFEDVIVHSDLLSSSSENCPDTVLKIRENFEKLARANLVHETNEAIGEIAQVHDEESLPEPDKDLLTGSFVQSEETSGSTCQLSRLDCEESQYGSEKDLYVQSEETQQCNGHEKSSQLDRKQSRSGSDQDLMFVQNEEIPEENLSRLHREESQSESDKELYVQNEELQKSNCHENLAQVGREERQSGSNQDLITKLFVQNEETPKGKWSQLGPQESQPGLDKALCDQHEETPSRTCCFNENLIIERASIQNEETCLGKCQDHSSDQRFSVNEDFLLGQNEEKLHGKWQEQLPGQNNEELQSGSSIKTDFVSELGYVRNEETPKSSKTSPNGQLSSGPSGRNEENPESNAHHEENLKRSTKASPGGHPLSRVDVRNEEKPESDAHNEETPERSSKASPKDQFLSETGVENPKSDENNEETLKRLSKASPKSQPLSGTSAKNEESPKSYAHNKGTSKRSSKVSTNCQSFSEADVENPESEAHNEENPKGSSKAPPKGQLSSEASLTNKENLVSGAQSQETPKWSSKASAKGLLSGDGTQKRETLENDAQIEETSGIFLEIEEAPESIVHYEEIQASNVQNAESICKEHLSRQKLEESQAKTYIQNEETQGTIWMNCKESGSAEASQKEVFLSGASVQSEEIFFYEYREQLLVQKEERRIRNCEETPINLLLRNQPLSGVKEVSENTCHKQLSHAIPKSFEKLPQLQFEETKTQPDEAAVNEETLRSAPLTKASVNTVYVENEDSQTGSDESFFTEETYLSNREESQYEPSKLPRLGPKDIQNEESALSEETCEERRKCAIGSTVAVEEESHHGYKCTGKEDKEEQARDNEEGSSYASEESFGHFSTSELVANSEARSTEDYMDACETGLSVEDICTNEETSFVKVGIRETIQNFEAMSQKGCEDRTKKFKVSGLYDSRIEEWGSSPKSTCGRSVKKICEETYLQPCEESWSSSRVFGIEESEEECSRLNEESWCPSKFVKLQGVKTPVKKNCEETYLSPTFVELQEGESSVKKAFREDLASESEEETRKDFLSDVRRLIDGFERTVYFNRDVKKKLLVEKYREEAKEALNHYVEAITTEWPNEFLLEDEDWVCSRCSEKEEVTWLGFFIDGRILDVMGYVLLLCFVMFLVKSSRSVFMQFGDFHK